MLKNLDLRYVGNDLTAQIDNEIQRLEMYEIIKFNTQFFNNGDLNTILNAPINVDLSLKYIIPSTEQEETEENLQPILKGVVYLSLMSLSGQTVYDKQIINFKNGIIQTQFPNRLPIGEYALKAEYYGTRYYEATSIILQFTVNRRKIKCIFDPEMIEAYPNSIVNIGLTLVDFLNNKKIGNCIINYSFDNVSYITQTDETGYTLLTAQMPGVDPELCVNTSIPKYQLEVSIDSNIYELISQTKVDVFVKPYNTELSYNIVVNEADVHIEGDVYGSDDDNNLIDVEYGTIAFNISELEPHPYIETSIDDDGHFSFDTVVVQSENANVLPSDPILYSSTIETKTIVEITNGELVDGIVQVSRNYVEKHKIGFRATVTTKTNKKPVSYGMVSFVITKSGAEIYRYITELSDEGEALFYFDVSKKGTYQIKVYYHSIFEYQASQSSAKKYKIVEDA